MSAAGTDDLRDTCIVNHNSISRSDSLHSHCSTSGSAEGYHSTSTRHSHQTCQILWISATKVKLRTSKTQARFCTVMSLHRMASLCIGFQQQLKERLILSPAVSRLLFVQLQAGPRSLRLQQPLASVKVCQPSRHQVKQLEQTCRSILRLFQWTLLQLSRVRITVTCKFKHLWVALVLKVKPWVKFHPYLYRDSSNWNVATESTIFWQFLELKRSHFTICSDQCNWPLADPCFLKLASVHTSLEVCGKYFSNN